MSTRRLLIAVLTVALLACGAFFFLHDKSPTATGDGSTLATPASGLTVGQLAETYLAAVPEETPVATVQGRVRRLGGGWVPATLSVISLESSDRSTVLRWRLSAAEEVRVDPGSLNRKLVGQSSDAVVIESKQTDQKLRPGYFEQVALNSCTCSPTPDYLTERGVDSSTVFSSLDTGASEAQVKVPGFPAVTVPVTRR